VARRFAWEISGEVDFEGMHSAAEILRGRHDFGAFGRSPKPGGGTVRTVHDISVRRATSICGGEHLPVVVIEVTADAFLYGMMRAIAGRWWRLPPGGSAARSSPRRWRIPAPVRSGHGGPGPRTASVGRLLWSGRRSDS